MEEYAYNYYLVSKFPVVVFVKKITAFSSTNRIQTKFISKSKLQRFRDFVIASVFKLNEPDAKKQDEKSNSQRLKLTLRFELAENWSNLASFHKMHSFFLRKAFRLLCFQLTFRCQTVFAAVGCMFIFNYFHF